MSLKKLLSAFAAAGGALLLGAQAHAGCQLQSVDIPVETQGLRAYVTAKIAGKPVKMILDSGAFFSILDSKFVAENKLSPVKVAAYTGSHLVDPEQLLTSGVAGKEHQTGVVSAPSFEFAGASFAGAQFFAQDFGETAGILGENILHPFDDDYDLKNGKLKLIRAQDCGGMNLAYWVKPEQTYSVVELESTDRHDLSTKGVIEINGVKLKATFDTGSPLTFITERAAARAGVKTTDPDVTAAGTTRGLDGTVRVWAAKFASIKVGDEEIRNSRMLIGDSPAHDFDVLIGADFFMAHHVYVANSQGKIYFTYSGGPVFRTPTAEQLKAAEERKAAASGGDSKTAK